MTRTFVLRRTNDVSGVSGLGDVAEGTVFSDGTTVLRWLRAGGSTAVYDSLERMEAIHGHDGGTTVVWPAPDLGAGLREAAERIAALSEADIRDYEQGLCFFCGAGYDVVPGPRGGVTGDRKQKPRHESTCSYVALREALAAPSAEPGAGLREALATWHGGQLGQFGHRAGDHFDECEFCAMLHGSGFAYPLAPSAEPPETP